MRDSILLEGGPMAGYRVPSERQRDHTPPPTELAFIVHTGPTPETAIYRDTGRVRVEFVCDTPIYSYQAHS